MLQVIVENKYGEQLDLSNNADYYLLSVGGLTPPTATINTGVIATKDGSVFNSSRLNDRNIVLTIAPRQNIEISRINLYKYFKSKQYVKLYLKNRTRNVYIEGYVENMEGDLYENPQKLQISVICPNPYFKDVETNFYEFSNVTSAFEFPFSIDSVGVAISNISPFTEVDIINNSDDEVGVVIELRANGLCLEPTIYNMTTNEHFTFELEMYAGDVVTVNTNRGEKGITLLRDGVYTNLINNVTRDSKWLNLIVGDNIFSYTTLHGAENLNVNVILQPVYEGI